MARDYVNTERRGKHTHTHTDFAEREREKERKPYRDAFDVYCLASLSFHLLSSLSIQVEYFFLFLVSRTNDGVYARAS